MAVLPRDPYRFPDDTPVCDRVDAMEALAAEGASDPLVRAWAAPPGGASVGIDARAAAWLLRRVQGLRYAVDAEGDWVSTPRAVLLTGGGDCKRLATLLAAACRVAGIPARIVWVTQPGAPLNHVSLVVWVDGAWRWADPSVRGAALGEPPYAATRRLGQVDRRELAAGG